MADTNRHICIQVYSRGNYGNFVKLRNGKFFVGGAVFLGIISLATLYLSALAFVIGSGSLPVDGKEPSIPPNLMAGSLLFLSILNFIAAGWLLYHWIKK
jgi:hypothetical protein